ncbi:LOW QUALITY PROTEIN: beta-galactosidase-like [Acropora millepora]|uniref:LOW QUALITY PROTEIN: beta-galactosidase-like n=1 Tax=Acropora millepora TaxID=45264 RepID=UPI001CF247B0|nr:LOW QUALITY PROTEIN: beta-galactosidase-like [Acropora millepora]
MASGAAGWRFAVLIFLLGIHFSFPRSFTIDYKNDVFLKDGEPFRYISGSFHYFRVPKPYWEDRMKKMKSAGLNALQTYVAWNLHEPKEGVYDFNGNNDVESFIRMAQSAGLLVIVRAGPYICAEWDLGGLPPWLLKNYTTAKFRSSTDKDYLAAVDRWMSVLLPKLKPLLYANGGPIIAVQVENEYGSYFTCDHQYMSHLQALFEKYLGQDVILSTVDGYSDKMLECGSLPSLFTTVDFGPGIDPAKAFAVLRKYQPNGPLVNSEFYPGWLDHWGGKHQTRGAADVAKYLDMILALNASVNMYMFEGGTNFGFMNGANGNSDYRIYEPQPTSYDYDAPLTEAGDPSTKYFVLMETIAKYAPVPAGPVPPASQKFAYGKVMMKKSFSFFDVLANLSVSGPVVSNGTLTMEQLGQNYGFLMYRTKIPGSVKGSTANISIPGLRDRGVVFVNQVRQATLIRVSGRTKASITVSQGGTLDILVENMGRINYGPHLQDPKGILGIVTLGEVELMNWKMYPLDFDPVVAAAKPMYMYNNMDEYEADTQIPSFYSGVIPPAPDGIPRDTFLKLPGWFKGQAYVNGFNIGRYWPVLGPQIAMYVPATALSDAGYNMNSKLVLFEVDNAPCQSTEKCYVEFLDRPLINGAVHPMKGEVEMFQDWTAKYADDDVLGKSGLNLNIEE